MDKTVHKSTIWIFREILIYIELPLRIYRKTKTIGINFDLFIFPPYTLNAVNVVHDKGLVLRCFFRRRKEFCHTHCQQNNGIRPVDFFSRLAAFWPVGFHPLHPPL